MDAFHLLHVLGNLAKELVRAALSRFADGQRRESWCYFLRFMKSGRSVFWFRFVFLFI